MKETILNAQSCELFDLNYFQFSQLKKYQPEDIPIIKARYKTAWETWRSLNLALAAQLGSHFAEPHIERWCNGWQVRAHFFSYFKYQCYQDSAAILSVILNRRRLSVSLDWHCYRADRSFINVDQYNQWLAHFDFNKYADFDIWKGEEGEYADYQKVAEMDKNTLHLNQPNTFWCIGKNIEKAELAQTDVIAFIYQTIRQLLPLYEVCHLEKI